MMSLDSATADPKASLKSRVRSLVLKPTLRVKLLFIIISASLIIVGVSTFLLLSYQRQQLIETAQSSATAMSNAIEATLHHAMLTEERELVVESVKAVMQVEEIEALRILNAQGQVKASSVEGEFGAQIDRSQPECQICHQGVEAPSSKSVIFDRSDGRQSLLTVNLIHNQPECYACHSPDFQILGLMIVETPVTTLNDQLKASFWQTMLIALATFALLMALIVPALDRSVLKPLEGLSKGVVEISAGNLDYRVPVMGQDEIGELAESFDHMRQTLKHSLADRERREHELAILNEVGLAATQTLDLNVILELAMDTMVNKLGMSVAMIYLMDEETGRHSLRASHGLTAAQTEEIARRRRSGWDITQEVVTSGREVFIPNMAEDVRFHGVWDELEGRSYVKLPMMSRSTVVGVLGAITPPGQSMSLREVEYLKALGREIGIAIDNALLLADTRQREKQAMTLYKLGTQISASLTLRDVLNVVAQSACELMSTDIGLVGLLDIVHRDIVISAVAGEHNEAILGMRLPVHESSPWSALMKGQPIIANEETLPHTSLHDESLVTGEEVASLLAVPLELGESNLGLIEVMSCKPRRFLPRDAQLLLRLAHQVVIAIENAQLYRKLRYLAMLEERDRLAGEMHDHLSQGLGYLKVKAAITSDLMTRGEIDQAQESLLELKKASQILYTDVREDIFNLRTSGTERLGFFSSLQDYLSDYQVHYGLDVNLSVEDGCLADFSPEIASQLLRIIQEALTNVRRHTDAHKVSIHCMQGGDQVHISIEDDGAGFSPHQVAEEAGQHFGLQIMRERAESVGGSLELSSQPGQGTRVLVRVPCGLGEV